MGARKITTVAKVVIPAAVSGWSPRFILAISRAIGETMVVFIAAGAAGNPPFDARARSSPGQTMTAAMAARGPGHRPGRGRGPHLPEPLLRRRCCSSSSPCSLNLIADRFVRRVRQTY